MTSPLILGCRASPLSRRQSDLVITRLRALTAREIVLRPIIAKEQPRQSDLIKDGLKGVFTHALERALIAGEIDLAVHSMKDVPGSKEMARDLVLHSVLMREDPRDALISRHNAHSLADLPRHARIATSSPRRQAQIRDQRPDLAVSPLRGNVDTRLAKAVDYDGIILAASGLVRLEKQKSITAFLDPQDMVPAAGQGILAAHYRRADEATAEILTQLIDPNTQTQSQAERGVLHGFGGSCDTPLAAHATIQGDHLHLRAQFFGESGRIEKNAQIALLDQAPDQAPNQAWDVGVQVGTDLRLTADLSARAAG